MYKELPSNVETAIPGIDKMYFYRSLGMLKQLQKFLSFSKAHCDLTATYGLIQIMKKC